MSVLVRILGWTALFSSLMLLFAPWFVTWLGFCGILGMLVTVRQ